MHDLNGRELLGERVTVEHARGPRRGGGGGGGGGGRDRRRPWLDKYGPPTRTNYRIVVENLSSKVSWQVSVPHWFNTPPAHDRRRDIRKRFVNSVSALDRLRKSRKEATSIAFNIPDVLCREHY